MRLLLTIILLVLGFSVQAQSFQITVDTNTCRITVGNALQKYHFQAERTRYIDRNNNIIIFDDRRSVGLTNTMITNYANFTLLKADLDSWFETCNVSVSPTPPGPSALFANGDALELDGSAEWVQIPDAISLTMADGSGDLPFTWSGWVRYEDVTNAVMLAKTDGVSNWEYTLSINASDNLEVKLYDATAVNSIGVESSITLTSLENEYNHLAVTYDGSGANTGLTLYINGIDRTGATSSAGTYVAMENTSVPPAIGFDGVNYTDGIIDQWCLFKGVELTLPEIKEIMTVRDISNASIYTDSLVVYYQYDNDDATAGGITDLSSAGNNGSLQNGDATNFVQCIPWPYPYQLDTSATWANLTPMQSSADTFYGGFAIDYDGSTEYTTISDNDALSHTDNSMYIAGWIQMDDATNFSIFDKVNEYKFFVNASDKLEARFIDASTGGYIGRTYNTAITNWQDQYIYVEASLNGATSGDIDIKLNGSVVDDTDANSGSFTAMENTASNVTIAYDGNSLAFANGRIGDVVTSGSILTSRYNAHAPVDLTTTGDALVGYWRGFNSTNVASGVLDQSGNGLNGTPTNTDLADFQYTTPREIYDADTAGSFDFSGVSEYINITDSDSLTFTTLAGTSDTSFTISFWVNLDNSVAERFLAKYGASAATREWLIATDGSSLLFARCYDASASAYIGRKYNTSLAGTLGNWQHIAATYSGGATNASIKLYIDGVQVDDTDNGSGSYTAMENTTNDTRIGASDLVVYLNGKMSNVSIMKGVELTQCQVQEIYNDGSPETPTDWTFWSNNFIHYNLNQTDSATTAEGISNISPNGSCNGTATNMDATNIITTSYPTN